jgi:hypothetical protein
MSYLKPKIESVQIADVMTRLGPARALIYIPGGSDAGGDDGGASGSGKSGG